MGILVAFLAVNLLIFNYLRNIYEEKSDFEYCIIYTKSAQYFFLFITFTYMFLVPILNRLIIESNTIESGFLFFISSLPIAFFYIHTKSFFIKLNNAFLIERSGKSITTLDYKFVTDLIIVKDQKSNKSQRVVFTLSNHKKVISLSSDFKYVIKYKDSTPSNFEEIANYIENCLANFGVNPKYVYESDDTCGGA